MGKRIIFGLSLLVSISGMGSLMIASDKLIAPKKRSISELIEFAISKGSDHPMDRITAKQLGFKGEMPAKSLWYSGNRTPDKHDHYFDVIYLSSSSGHIEPIGLVWSKYRAKAEVKKQMSYNHDIYYSDPDGPLRIVLHGSGVPGHPSQIKVEIDKNVKEHFEIEKNFFLIDSIGLAPSK